MFDISWGELVLIGMIALIVIGPKELPTVLRTVGQWVTKIRRMASEFQGQFQEAMREAEFAELKQQVDAISDPTKSLSEYNPLETARQEIEGAFDDKPETPPAKAEQLASADAPPAPPAEAASSEPSAADAASEGASPSAPAEPVPAATQPDVGGGRAA
ncbi:MAG TPA: Sec-independent protein translocase protein TatB [Xanthobacteraceae bacterium]|nr:Sec-independent protein translocase protein TatB [Xanthobacteraceae bacterium]